MNKELEKEIQERYDEILRKMTYQYVEHQLFDAFDRTIDNIIGELDDLLDEVEQIINKVVDML